MNYYDLLGVKSDALSEDIKHAFFDKSKKASYSFVNRKIKRHRRAASHSLVSPVREPTVPTVGFLTVCFHVVAPSVNKDVHVYLPCDFGVIEGGDNSAVTEKKTWLHV